jgi:hypothetical protein
LEAVDRAMAERPALRAVVALPDEGWGRAVSDLQPEAWWASWSDPLDPEGDA